MAPSAVTISTSTDKSLLTTPSGTPQNDGGTISPLASICYGPTLPGIPQYPTFATHRVWALTHMTAVFRHWSRAGFTEGMSGHISLRDPEYPSLFWINPLAVHFGLLRASDMLLVSDDQQDGQVILAGNRLQRPANYAGWAIHAAVHRARADVSAACHAHTVAGKAWSAAGRRLEMLDQDVCNFYGEAGRVYDEYGGVAVGRGAVEEGEAIARALGSKGKGMVLVNHGLLTVGHTVDEAGFLFGLLERSCDVQLRVLAVDGGVTRRVIGDKEAEFNFQMASTPETLYWEFQPYFDYEQAISHDVFDDVHEKDLRLDFERYKT